MDMSAIHKAPEPNALHTQERDRGGGEGGMEGVMRYYAMEETEQAKPMS